MSYHFTSLPANIAGIILTYTCCIALACGSPVASRSLAVTRSTFESDRPFDDAPLVDSEISNSRIPPKETESLQEVSDEASPRADRPVRGFRIQVHSLQNKNAAEAAAAKLRQQLQSLGAIRTYVDFESSLYKIRVGDFPSRTDAIHIQDILRKKPDYRDAWIVETMINP